jgi:hypothetical protein
MDGNLHIDSIGARSFSSTLDSNQQGVSGFRRVSGFLGLSSMGSSLPILVLLVGHMPLSRVPLGMSWVPRYAFPSPLQLLHYPVHPPPYTPTPPLLPLHSYPYTPTLPSQMSLPSSQKACNMVAGFTPGPRPSLPVPRSI